MTYDDCPAGSRRQRERCIDLNRAVNDLIEGIKVADPGKYYKEEAIEVYVNLTF